MWSSFSIIRNGIVIQGAQSGSGLPVLFAHGLTSSMEWSKKQCAPLTSHYRVIVFNQRGHGNAGPLTDPAAYDCRSMSEDIGFILDNFEIKSAVIGGESMGAATALRYALDNKNRCKALLLVSPAFDERPFTAFSEIYAIGDAMLQKGAVQFAHENDIAMQAAGVSKSASRAWCEILASHHGASMHTACRTVPHWKVCELNELYSFGIPVQIIARENDAVHPLSLAEGLIRKIPNSVLITTGKDMDYFEDPSLVGKWCADFLAEL